MSTQENSLESLLDYKNDLEDYFEKDDIAGFLDDAVDVTVKADLAGGLRSVDIWLGSTGHGRVYLESDSMRIVQYFYHSRRTESVSVAAEVCAVVEDLCADFFDATRRQV